MTTIEKMVTAMKAEISRQATEGGYFVGPGTGGVLFMDGHFDQRKIAEAGLSAIHKATDSMTLAVVRAGDDRMDAVHFWEGIMEGILAGKT